MNGLNPTFDHRIHVGRFPRRETVYSLRVVPLEICVQFRLQAPDACVLTRLCSGADFCPALPRDERDSDRVVRWLDCEVFQYHHHRTPY